MVEARGRGEGQAVGRLKPRPAVRAADEFLRQAEFELRMLRQVAERADAERLRALLAHRQRIAVIKAERHRHAEAERRERPVQVREAGIAFQLEDLLGDGARVFRVEVDRAGLERRIENAGVAQAGPVYAAAGRAQDDFAEDVGLGEALGADGQRFRMDGKNTAGKQKPEPIHAARSSLFAPASRNCSAARLA